MNIWLILLFNLIFLFFVVLVLFWYMKKKILFRVIFFDFIFYCVVVIIIVLMLLNLFDNIYFGLIILVVWGVFFIILDFVCMRSKWIYNLIYGKERVLIKCGKIMEDNLLKERMIG